jgi:hypothetical protein
MMTLCTQILSGHTTRLARHRPDLPRGLVQVVHRCLQIDPAERYADIAELAEALSPYCPGSEDAVRRIRRRLAARTSGEIMIPSGGIDVQAPTEPSFPGRNVALSLSRPKRHHGKAAAFVGASVLALAAMGFTRRHSVDFDRLAGAAGDRMTELGRALSASMDELSRAAPPAK